MVRGLKVPPLYIYGTSRALLPNNPGVLGKDAISGKKNCPSK